MYPFNLFYLYKTVHLPTILIFKAVDIIYEQTLNRYTQSQEGCNLFLN